MPRDVSPSEALNLGAKSDAALARISIKTLAQLRRVGAVAAYVRLRRAVTGISLNMLYALAGAIDGEDWPRVRRERKLQLLMQVEDFERTHARRPPQRSARVRDELLALRNVGPAMRRDFEMLGINTVRQLARCNPDRLYARLQRRTGTRHDPCVWDTFAAAIHQARSGEALPWWHFTRERKRREAEGSFPRPFRPAKIGT
jgi:hypothetical protein